MRHFPALILFLFTCIGALNSQEQWSLERCIAYALDKSLTIQQAQLTLENQEIALRQARMNRLPRLNASSTGGTNFGRVINPATNFFETENSTFVSFGANAGLTLFSGSQVNNAIKRSKLDVEAAEEDLTQAQYDIALNIALAYLNVLFSLENLSNAENKRTLTEQQLDQMDKLIAAGARPEAERFDILAQLALDEQDIVNAQNTYALNMLTLKQLMLLDASEPFDIERPEISVEDIEPLELMAFEEIFTAALNAQPSIRAAELRIRSAEADVDFAKGALYPSLGIGASIGTNYSNLVQRATGFIAQRIPQPGVFINGESVQFEVFNDMVPTGFEKTPFFTQLDNNLGYGFSATLSIPIFNNWSNRASLERAKLNILQQRNSKEQVRQFLSTDIQNALTSARAARKSLQAAERTFEARDIAFRNISRRFEVGAINTFDYIDAQNRLESSRISLTIAKYEYLFRIEILEFYLGRGLQL